MGSHAEVSQMAEADLTDYNYIYPIKPSVHILSSFYDFD